MGSLGLRCVTSCAVHTCAARYTPAQAWPQWTTKNLWPEPWPQAHKSDPRENAWKRKVCNGALTLRQAQKLELAYKCKYG